MTELKVCPDRGSINRNLSEATGIYIRAIGLDGRWGSYDIAQLDKPSLTAWLRSGGGHNELAENTVALLLGHS